ncbi:hypothetical protein FLT15_04405 [Paenibacillus thiaminolyticus]|uniref:hypothetical protein n=1 Tax=Paenibacillus thiaminolyticus TaxID=49283 RepID=UPI0011655A84|nr:hypothetical protein [Paenibacillus thiaminolyticus]NGP57654.1 hypothetical protein [Paenibacillus thiaminolyticus]
MAFKDLYLLINSAGVYIGLCKVIDSKIATPKMTSNTKPRGRAFAISILGGNYDVWKAFNQVDDQGYTCDTRDGSIGYLGFEFEKPIIIGKYAVRSMNTTDNIRFMPKDWTFEGSNDGVNWDILDIQTDQSWYEGTIPLANTDKLYSLTNITKYKMYRLNWTKNNGGHITGFNELKMYELIDIQIVNMPLLKKENIIKYGIDKLNESIFKGEFLKKLCISDKANALPSGKIFEHEIDLKKYDVIKITI